jgi:hypothetical protein
MNHSRNFVAALISVAFFVLATHFLNSLPRKQGPEQLDVAISPPVQIMLAGGDRYLSANIETVRLIVLNVLDLDQRDLPILALAHRNVAFMQPCQEDNYYVAQAFLPWSGELDAADEVLEAARKCRTWDIMPGFLEAFNAFYFRKDNMRAGKIYEETAAHLQGNDRDRLLYMASQFFEKGENLGVAAVVIRNLEKNATNEKLKSFLGARARRVEILMDLRNAAETYAQRKGVAAKNLQELVAAKLLPEMPVDPLGKGFEVDASGVVQVRN